MSDLDAAEALKPAMDAFRRGTKRSRLRTFAAVCSNGHTLLEVFPTASGPVALWASPEFWGHDDAGEVVRLKPPRRVWEAAFVDGADLTLDPEDRADAVPFEDRANVICRCTEQSTIDLHWVQSQLEAGTRRAIIATL